MEVDWCFYYNCYPDQMFIEGSLALDLNKMLLINI